MSDIEEAHERQRQRLASWWWQRRIRQPTRTHRRAFHASLLTSLLEDGGKIVYERDNPQGFFKVQSLIVQDFTVVAGYSCGDVYMWNVLEHAHQLSDAVVPRLKLSADKHMAASLRCQLRAVCSVQGQGGATLSCAWGATGIKMFDVTVPRCIIRSWSCMRNLPCVCHDVQPAGRSRLITAHEDGVRIWDLRTQCRSAAVTIADADGRHMKRTCSVDDDIVAAVTEHGGTTSLLLFDIRRCAPATRQRRPFTATGSGTVARVATTTGSASSQQVFSRGGSMRRKRPKLTSLPSSSSSSSSPSSSPSASTVGDIGNCTLASPLPSSSSSASPVVAEYALNHVTKACTHLTAHNKSIYITAGSVFEVNPFTGKTVRAFRHRSSSPSPHDSGPAWLWRQQRFLRARDEGSVDVFDIGDHDGTCRSKMRLAPSSKHRLAYAPIAQLAVNDVGSVIAFAEAYDKSVCVIGAPGMPADDIL
ncbi:hypothetical protein PTSG_10532 [Salpingoeca rosetta]|uniref:Uncharacterized protein n=1 Tax=Salpingoeca rosetta (strain ATCC 50818 / BSB-021) TaxID=946362 RepID=F2URM1_SALR5|nr:uncharacterized protein PTSG_10532 [Salpingoeca rosetta]EGD80276.1 hypothetical protein PTSG_10532 [Salpingoeca rosetta]|eukprot:XP_004988066.1 hypothetical protein PTSG_10532 [Salpingoeca rosetta]